MCSQLCMFIPCALLPPPLPLPLRLIMENSCSLWCGQRKNPQLGMPPPETADIYSPKGWDCKEVRKIIIVFSYCLKKQVSSTALASSSFSPYAEIVGLVWMKSGTIRNNSLAWVTSSLWKVCYVSSPLCAAKPMALSSPTRCVCVCACTRVICCVWEILPGDTQSVRSLPNALRLKALTRNVLLPAQMGPRIMLDHWRKPELAHSRPSALFLLKPKIYIRGTVQSVRF